MTNHHQTAASGTSKSTLEKRLATHYSRLSARRRRLISRLLDNPEETFFLSSRKLAQHLNVDPATIVRTAQALGYEGFIDFAEDLRQHFVKRVTPYSVMRAAASEPRSARDHVAQSIRHDLENLSRIQAQIDMDKLQSAADLLCGARRIIVAGMDLAYTMSYWLAYSLTVIGINAEAPQDRAQLRYKTKLVAEGDVVVGITFRRCMKDTVEAVERAKSLGATTIALTDAETNPIGRRADITLLSSIEGPVITGSQVAPICVLNSLLVACAHSHASHTLEALTFSRDEYEQGGRWCDDKD